MIDAYASLEHYWRHLEPIWAALPDEVRGRSYSPAASKAWGEAIPARWARDRPVLVAGYADALKAAPRPVVYVEHGAGQHYPGDPRSVGNPSYAGGSGLEGVQLFICPSEAVAGRWRARYPATPAAVVGSPWLDAWHGGKRPCATSHRAVRGSPSGGRLPTVALTFHWACPEFVPEARWAFPHYDPVLERVVEVGNFLPLGHGHPRSYGVLERRWRQLGIAHTAQLADVFDQADVLVADNTSAMWEFASLGRPIVVLDAPWYRREVHHGLRFWEHADAGVRIADPAQLGEAIAEALEDRPEVAARRQAAVAEVYDRCDGGAAQRAVEAILERLESLMPNPKAPRRSRTASQMRNPWDELGARLVALGADGVDLDEFRAAWLEAGPDERVEMEARVREVGRLSDGVLRRMIAVASGDDPDSPPDEEPIEQDPGAVALGVYPTDEVPPAPTPDGDGEPVPERVGDGEATADPAPADGGFEIAWPVPRLIEWAAGDPLRIEAVLAAEQQAAAEQEREVRRTLVTGLGAGNGNA